MRDCLAARRRAPAVAMAIRFFSAVADGSTSDRSTRPARSTSPARSRANSSCTARRYRSTSASVSFLPAARRAPLCVARPASLGRAAIKTAAVSELSVDRRDSATACHSSPLSCSTERARLSSATASRCALSALARRWWTDSTQASATATTPASSTPTTHRRDVGVGGLSGPASETGSPSDAVGRCWATSISLLTLRPCGPEA